MADIAALQGVDNGSFRVGIDQIYSNIYDINLTTAADYNDIASIIQTALRAVGLGGFTNAVVTASAATGSDVTLNIISGSHTINSFVTNLLTATPILGTDISVEAYLNGQTGNYYVDMTIYDILAADATDFTTLNQANPQGPQLLPSIFYNLLTSSNTAACVPKINIDDPMYSQWYDAMEAYQSFSTRTEIDCKIEIKV